MKKIIILLMAITASFGSFAQKAKANSDANKEGAFVSAYSCPMHPEIISNKPGKCSKCGRDLTLSKKERLKSEVVKLYACPRHPEVTSDKPGKCSKCGTNLALSSKEKMKMEVMKMYTCPMHPDVTSDKSGKCPKCGKDMVEKKI